MNKFILEYRYNYNQIQQELTLPEFPHVGDIIFSKSLTFKVKERRWVQEFHNNCNWILYIICDIV